MNKYGFRIRTRGGMTVENLLVQAPGRAEAEAKLRQIYHGCEVLECSELGAAAAAGLKGESLDLEGMITLIGKQEEKP